MSNFCLVSAWVLTAVFLVLRIVLPGHGLHPEDIFKDLAHVYVGALLGAAAVSKNRRLWFYFALLCVVEVIAALSKN